MKKYLVLALYLIISLAMLAQAPKEETTDKEIKNLANLVQKIHFLEDSLEKLKKEAVKSKLDELRAEIIQKIEAHKKALEETRQRFTEAASQIEVDYENKLLPMESKSLVEEIQAILSPVFDSFRKVSETPRKIQKLQNENHIYSDQEKDLELGVQRVKNLLKTAQEKDYIKELNRSLAYLEGELNEVQLRLESNQQVLDQLHGEEKTVWEKTMEMLNGFLKTKGKNLLAFFGSLFGVLFVGLFVKKWLFSLPVFKSGKWIHLRTPLELLYLILCILMAILCSLAALYLLNDIVLLTLMIMLIVGVLWSLKGSIPKVVEEFRLAFNLGSVREGHVIIWKGVPWLVHKIGFISELINPYLSGGKVRVMARELVHNHSRPVVPGESWFPSKVGHYVELADGSYGQINQQTPDNVVIEFPGKVKKYFQTADYYSQRPKNYSQGFRLEFILGVDYSHQASVTSKVLEELKEYLEKQLFSKYKEIEIQASFHSAAESSLNFWVGVICPGDLAVKRRSIEMEVQSLFVDFCNHYQYSIPFNQLTVHMAK